MTRHNARWIKPDNRSWMRHDIAPPVQPRKHGSAWFIAALVTAVLGFMAYGMFQIDSKHGTPPATEQWEVAE